MADDIEPGSDASYQICKQIYLFHPLGAKMAEAPVSMAQSQQRIVTVNGPEGLVRRAFLDEWKKLDVDRLIFNVMSLSRIYGLGSVALLILGVSPEKPVDYAKLHEQTIAFNVFDPLNTAGSLVLNQDPNAFDFLKSDNIVVSGTTYHRSRAFTKMNEQPIYIGYTQSAFGYVGRSVYQRALFPLKSFVQTMITDDMVTRKSGVLIAKIKQPGSIINNMMAMIGAQKRNLLKEAKTDNVLQIDIEESIESLNMQNVNNAMTTSRENILKNIATAADMPAQLLNQETMAEGFGEGSEDAKLIARYVDRLRIDMQSLYEWFDRIVQYRAWSPSFYKTIQTNFPDQYASMSYEEAFYDWRNSFVAEWPSLLTEPDSEKIKVDDTKLKAIIGLLGALLPLLDPDNRATTVQWAADNFNELELLFTSPLLLDYEALAAHGADLDAAQTEERQANLDAMREGGESLSRDDSVLATLGVMARQRTPDGAVNSLRKLARHAAA